MITKVTIPARACKCEVCGYEWISIAVDVVLWCQNRECRSREWNGKKEKKKPEKKPEIVLPKPVKVRGGEEEDGDF